MTREEKAVYYKHNGFNCCQSVIKAMLDLSDSDREILTNAASGFAVGMEATCGALIGATICKDLKGKDTGVVLCECDDCICNAIRAFDEVLPMESEREG